MVEKEFRPRIAAIITQLVRRYVIQYQNIKCTRCGTRYVALC